MKRDQREFTSHVLRFTVNSIKSEKLEFVSIQPLWKRTVF